MCHLQGISYMLNRLFLKHLNNVLWSYFWVGKKYQTAHESQFSQTLHKILRQLLFLEYVPKGLVQIFILSIYPDIYISNGLTN